MASDEPLCNHLWEKTLGKAKATIVMVKELRVGTMDMLGKMMYL